MTKAITYKVTFRTETSWAVEDIAAESPQAALAEARAIADDDERLIALDFQRYEDDLAVNEIIVESAGEWLAAWRDNDFYLRAAAWELLTALQHAVTALNTVHRFKVPKLATDSYAIAAECVRAIARAKGESTANAD